MAPSPVELWAGARQLLCELALTSVISARPLVGVVSQGEPDSAPPRGQAQHPVERWAAELEGLAGVDDVELEGFVRALSDELDRSKRRQLAEVKGHNLGDLAELVVDRGAGFTAAEVSIALRCTPTMVRRIRLAHGLDPERGRALRVNGHGAAFGVELVRNGYSVRAAAALSGVAASTLWDRARRGATSA